MSDAFLTKLYQIMVGARITEGGLLIIQGSGPEAENEVYKDYLKHITQSFIPFASEQQYVTGDVIDSIRRLRQIARESEYPVICLTPTWELLDKRRYSTEVYHKIRTELQERYPVARGRISLGALAIYDVLESMAEGSLLLVFVPLAVLQNLSESRLRSYIATRHRIRWILEYPGAWFLLGAYQGLQVCSLLIEAGEGEFRPVKMLRLPNIDQDNTKELLAEVARLSKQDGGQTEHGYVLRRPLPHDASWEFGVNHPDWERYAEDLGSVGETCPLGEVAHILRVGEAVLTDVKETATTLDDAVRISGREIGLDGELLVDFDPERSPVKQGFMLLEAGDLVMRRVFSPHQQTSIPAATVPVHDSPPLYADSSVIVIRLRENVEGVDPKWLLLYLRSRRAAKWLFSRSKGMPIQVDTIRELPTPIRDKDTTALWLQAEQLIEELATWRTQLDESRRQIFEHESVHDGHAGLIQSTLAASQRAQAARATETLDWKIRNLYPYPLAFRWREIVTMKRDYQKYRRILDAAEVFTAYLAIVALVLAENFGEKKLPGHLKTIAERLAQRPKSGTNFGDWLTILTEVAQGRRFRAIGPGTPFFEISSIFESENVKPELEHLKGWRDDDAHGRGPKTERETASALVEAERALEEVYRRADFLTKYPLRYVETASHEVRQQLIRYSYKDLVGDHPLVSTQEVTQSATMPLQQGAMYLATQGNEMYLVHPWLVRRACPTCGGLEVYTLDRLDESSGAVMVKSLDYGHVLEADDLRADLLQLGVIPD